MARPRKVSTEAVALIRYLHELGVPVTALGKRFGISRETVRNIVNQQGMYQWTNEEAIEEHREVVANLDDMPSPPLQGAYAVSYYAFAAQYKRSYQQVLDTLIEIEGVRHHLMALLDRYGQ